MKKTTADRLSLFFQIFILVLAFAAMLFRVQRGVDFTDETWYVAEPVLVARGEMIPYVNSWSQTPGFTLPLAALFRLYLLLYGTTGIMLFSRILYLVWSFLVSLLTVWILRKGVSRSLPLITALPLLITTSLFDISYNTIGLTYLPLFLALVCALCGETGRRALCGSAISGIVAARMIIGTPYVMPAVFLVLLLLAVSKRTRLFLGIVLGGFLSAVLVVGWCCLRGGFSAFVFGMRAWLTDCYYFKIEPLHTLGEDIRYLVRYMVPAYLFFAVVAVLRLLFSKNDRAFSFSTAVLIVCFLAGAWKYYPGYSQGFPVGFFRFSWFQPFCFLFFREKDRNRIYLLVAAALFVLVYLFSSFANIYGFGNSREYWLIVPMVLSCLSLLNLAPWEFVSESGLFLPSKTQEERCAFFRALVYRCFSILMILVFLLQYKSAVRYIYMDEALPELTVKVESGIWKSCYTTREKAESIGELEAFIRSGTDKSDSVFFKDWASYGYLMSDAKACTCTALDPSPYLYNCNEPRVFFDYYKQVHAVPEHILYVAHSPDAALSIDAPEWEYNSFVSSFYRQTDTFQNSLFRVLKFEVTDPVAALAYAESHALQ